MNTKLLLVLVACFGLLSTLSSAAALYFVVEERRDGERLEERIEAIEIAIENLDRPGNAQEPQSSQLSATLNLLFKRLDQHERALDASVKRLSDLTAPRVP